MKGIVLVTLILSVAVVECRKHGVHVNREPQYSMLPESLKGKEIVANVHSSDSVIVSSGMSPPCPDGAECGGEPEMKVIQTKMRDVPPCPENAICDEDSEDSQESEPSVQVVSTQGVPPCPEGAECEEDTEPQMKVVQTQTQDVPPCPENADCETQTVQTSSSSSSSETPCEDDGCKSKCNDDDCGEQYIVAKIKSPCEGSDPCEENKIEIVKKLHDDDEEAEEGDDDDDEAEDEDDQKSLRFARVTDSASSKSTSLIASISFLVGTAVLFL